MITEQADLTSLCDEIARQGSAALDTEFVWERTYRPGLATIQVGLPSGHSHVIDYLEVNDLSALGKILADDAVVKLLHDAIQDLTILAAASGFFPVNVFDVRYAAGFCGLPSTLSLGALVKEMTGVELAKTETRTNWLHRPLSPQQIEYALDDVRYLHEVMGKELATLDGRESVNWLAADLRRLDNPEIYKDPDKLTRFNKTKGIGRMHGRELAVAFELVSWRDDIAKQKDLPREFVIPEKTLLGIAHTRPSDFDQLATVPGMSARLESKYGDDLLAAVARGLATPKNEIPEPRHQPDDLFVDKERIEAATQIVKRRATELGIDSVQVATRAHLLCFLRDEEARRAESPLASGWRYEQVGKLLEAI